MSLHSEPQREPAGSETIAAPLIFEPLEPRMLYATDPLFAVNAGGGFVTGTDGTVWEADRLWRVSQYVNASASGAGNKVTSTGDPVDLTHPSVPIDIPEAIFQSYRWDPTQGDEMAWAFPTEAGSVYDVELLFSENFFTAPGGRVFDVVIEGETMLAGYDPFVAAGGGDRAVVETFSVTSDGELNIDFNHLVNNPFIGGIRIFEASAQPQTIGLSTATLNFGAAENGQTVSQILTLTHLGATGEPGIDLTGFEITGPAAADFELATMVSPPPMLFPGDSFSVEVIYTAGDAGPAAASLEVMHTGLNTPLLVSLTAESVAPQPNQAPTLAPIADLTVATGQTTTLTLTASDPDGDGLSFLDAGFPSFVTLTDNDDGTATLEIVAPATPGSFTGLTVNVVDDDPQNPLGDSQSFNLTVETPSLEDEVDFRVNAGGNFIADSADGLTWNRDLVYRISEHVNASASGAGNKTGKTSANIDITDVSVPLGTPAALFQTYRWDPSQGDEMQWSFATTAGQTYDVRLYFAETFFTAPGQRVFDVLIDGQTVLPAFDPFAAAGAKDRGVVETFSVTSDGVINVDFSRIADNPAISAIEIVQLSAQPNVLGVSADTLDLGSVEIGESSNADLTFTNLGGSGDPDITIANVALIGTEPFRFAADTAGLVGAVLAPGQSVTVPVTFTPLSEGPETAQFQVTHTGANPISITFDGVGTVPAPNTAPTVNAITDTNLAVADGLTLAVSASDVDGDNITLGESGLPGFATLVDNGDGTGEIQITAGSAIEGTYPITITATDDGDPILSGSTSFTLSVTPDAPANFSLSQSTLAFGDVLVGESTTTNFTISHAGGSGDVTVTGLSLSGPDAAQFNLDSTAGFTLSPGQSNTVVVTYTPNDEGGDDATLTVDASGLASQSAAISGTGIAEAVISFGKSSLSGVTGAALAAAELEGLPVAGVTNPTTVEWGPDDRLYIGYQNGRVDVYSVTRNGADDYDATLEHQINDAFNLPNHDDDGTPNPDVIGRLMTGMIVRGTAAVPVIYTSTSDPRIGGGLQGENTDLDTNSGIVSRITWNPTTQEWDHLELVRGLPRSEENHTGNGMAIDEATNTLYLAYGGHTNTGQPSFEFALLPEYALSAAVLSIDLDAIGDTTYDLPTLDDEDRDFDGNGSDNDPSQGIFDPFGGNRGKNQAIIVPGGPVQVYSPGYRNPYGIVITAAGRMYVTDNGSNEGWGGEPIVSDNGTPGDPSDDYATNDYLLNGDPGFEGGFTFRDQLHYVPNEGFYAGHPNPTRADTRNTFNDTNPQSPVPTSNPIEGTFFRTNLDGALVAFGSSTNGITEYTASNFGGQMQGDLLVVSFGNVMRRLELNAAGDDVVSNTTLANSVSVVPLDVEAIGDDGPFPGTIWVVDYPTGDVIIYEPGDYDGNSGGNGSPDDLDGDGYLNQDEIDNGTSPTNPGDFPTDNDADFVSDLNDPDDDNDTDPDTSDPFAIDGQNGLGTGPSFYTWENDEGARGGLLNLGLTGLMTNGTDNYADLYFPEATTPGGAGGVFTIDAAGSGSAVGGANNLDQGYQFGVNTTGFTEPFVATTRTNSTNPGVGQEVGFFIGSGDQSNFIKLTVSGDDGGVIRVMQELSDVTVNLALAENPFPLGAEGVDLFLSVDPNTLAVQASYTVTLSGVTGDRTLLGDPIAIPASWIDGSAGRGLAVGLYATRGTGPSFPVTWDQLGILDEADGELSATPETLDFGSVVPGTTKTVPVTIKNLGQPGDSPVQITNTAITGADEALFSDNFDDTTPVTVDADGRLLVDVSFTPTVAGNASATLVVNHTGVGGTLHIPLTGFSDSGGAAAEIVIEPPSGNLRTASTFTSNSFVIRNESTEGEKLTRVVFDLSTAILPDIVFDPDGVAGDTGVTPKGFTPDFGGAEAGVVGHSFEGERNGGYDRLIIDFDDFDPGEVFKFSIDIDPTSIAGVVPPGPNHSGSVSGLEMTGATVTLNYDSGSVLSSQMFRKPNSGKGAKNQITADLPSAPSLSILGIGGITATVNDASQTLRITAPAGSTVSLLHFEAGLFLDGVPNGGFDIDPFEANSIISVDQVDLVVGPLGYVDVPVTLLNTDADGGLNYFTAVVTDGSLRTSPISEVVVLEYVPV
ncbi:MAG: malectin domain-containing carbohydrate-binding protein [Planctomycetota bacterium]